MSDALTVRQAAQLANIPTRTLYDLIAREQISIFRPTPHRIRIFRSELDAYLLRVTQLSIYTTEKEYR